jgi:hypothetical protein
MEVHRAFAHGFTNCIDAVAYLLKQGQPPKPRMVTQLAGLVPGVDKRCGGGAHGPRAQHAAIVRRHPLRPPAASLPLPPRCAACSNAAFSPARALCSATAFYLQHEGKAEYALDAVLAQCEASGEGEGGGGATAAAALEAAPPCASDGAWELVRQQVFSNSEFWPCGPYPLDDEAEAGGADDGDGWVHYDTSNWKPPQ